MQSATSGEILNRNLRSVPKLKQTIALVGNPNSGKTTIYNNLTGTHQHVGNYAEGFRKMFNWIEVVELNEPEDIFPTYEHAIKRQDNKSMLIIEHGNFYNQK